jgi:hypothetical protein
MLSSIFYWIGSLSPPMCKFVWLLCTFKKLVEGQALMHNWFLCCT